ncbi:hypothetical protein BGX27_002192 [Mortierella sp. AM989]|nr:hypothetical protein BGX27_002192 [Mortierella sp. AM989]
MVGARLATDDHVKCLRVCRDWRDTFLSLMWRSVTYDAKSRTKGLDAEALERHQDMIESLCVVETSHKDIPATAFKNLRSLRVMMESRSLREEMVEQALRDLILGAPRVKALDLAGIPFDWRTVSELSQLSSLVVRDYPKLIKNPELLWSTVCPRLSSLTIENTEVPDLEVIPIDMMFLNIKHLKIKSSTAAASMEWLKIANRFPHLERRLYHKRSLTCTWKSLGLPVITSPKLFFDPSTTFPSHPALLTAAETLSDSA